MQIKKFHYQSLDSTQEELKRLIKSNDNQSLTSSMVLLVSADEQSQGRGRFGRKWVSPAGAGLYFSFAISLERNFSNEQNSQIEFAEQVTKEAAHVVIESLQNYFGEVLDDLYLKPINDIYYADKKLAGILVEIINNSLQRFLIVGVGINLRVIKQEEIENSNEGKNAIAISLEQILAEKNFNNDFDKQALMSLIVEEFLKKYSSLMQV